MRKSIGGQSAEPYSAKGRGRLINLPSQTRSGRELGHFRTEVGQVGIDREIVMLESKLAEVSTWEKRLKELDELLGVGSVKKA